MVGKDYQTKCLEMPTKEVEKYLIIVKIKI
jgi:hypothetical protein